MVYEGVWASNKSSAREKLRRYLGKKGKNIKDYNVEISHNKKGFFDIYYRKKREPKRNAKIELEIMRKIRKKSARKTNPFNVFGGNDKFW
jgi:serine phosphatase RsbU (regulator of sigma subunit)